MAAIKMNREEKTQVERMIRQRADATQKAVRAVMERKRTEVREEVRKRFSKRAEVLQLQDVELKAQREELLDNLDAVNVRETARLDASLTLGKEIEAEVERQMMALIGTGKEIEASIDAKVNELRLELWMPSPEARALIERVPTVADLRKNGLSKILPSKELDKLLVDAEVIPPAIPRPVLRLEEARAEFATLAEMDEESAQRRGLPLVTPTTIQRLTDFEELHKFKKRHGSWFNYSGWMQDCQAAAQEKREKRS